MKAHFSWLIFLFSSGCSSAVAQKSAIYLLDTLSFPNGVTVMIEAPKDLSAKMPLHIIFYALPNGNTTAQAFGKKLVAGDDWHFDIQHIGAQTAFIRAADPNVNYAVAYVENAIKSWPAWRERTTEADNQIAALIAAVAKRYDRFHPTITLAAHSGGGSFIFGYLNTQTVISKVIQRIAFLDATYGYESDKYHDKLRQWLKHSKNHLEVMAYNDSVVVYNGKPLVSPTGGTWYRSKLMAADLRLQLTKTQQLWNFRSKNAAVTLIENPDKAILHTVLVEKNGFIHAILSHTPFENKGYEFMGARAYSDFIK